MDLNALLPLYQYCEAANYGFQYLNLISILAFPLVAVYMWIRRDHEETSPSFHEVSAIILFVIGVTGFLFHYTGKPLAMAFDLIAMFMMFIIIASAIANDMLNWSLGKGLLTIGAIIFGGALMYDQAQHILPQNTGLFLPFMFFVAIASLKVQTICHTTCVYLMTAAYLLFFGLLLRGLDMAVCTSFSHGSHFMWHIMLAFSMIYFGRAVSAARAIAWPDSKAIEKATMTKVN